MERSTAGTKVPRPPDLLIQIAMTNTSHKRDKLYNRDYYLWLEETAQLLKDRNLEKLDVVNLVEEIQDMGRSEKRAIESNLVVLFLHLLKYKYQPDKSWKSTIREHRRRLKKAFEDSPSLKGYFVAVFKECYLDGREQAADETGLPLATFPIESPFTSEETLNPNYLPE